MSGLLTSRLALTAAWFAVVAGLAAALTLAFLQPPPPPGGEPVTVALAPAETSEEAPPEEAPETPAQEAPEAVAGEAPEASAEEAPEASGEEAPEASAEVAPTATVALPQPAAEAPPAESVPPDQVPARSEAPAPAPELPAASVPLPPPPAEPAPAGQDQAAAAGAPIDKPSETDPADQEGATQETTPAAVAALPPAKPEPPAEVPAPAEGQTEGGTEAKDAGAPGPQQVAIPTIPPALEQLLTWERYRQPFNLDDKRPRIAVVLTGLGLSDSATEAAINQLPSAVTLSFSPYARNLERWIALARARGHEVMLDLPMEPATFPNEDPGPQGLLVGLSPEENLDRLDWVLSRGSAYVGLAGAMGSRFTAAQASLEPVLREIKDRGLIFLDRRTTEDSLVPALAAQLDLPAAINNRSVDERQASRVAIDARLAQIERIALTEGFAVAMAQPYPVTLDRLAEWSTAITSRGFALAPISALAGLQKAR